MAKRKRANPKMLPAGKWISVKIKRVGRKILAKVPKSALGLKANPRRRKARRRKSRR